MSKLVDISGKQFSRLKVIRHSHKKSKKNMWECLCDCGTTSFVETYNITSGHTKSCGCLSSEMKKARIKHGMRNTLEYTAWSRMKQRCLDKNYCRYHEWGGRGITVCDEWISSFPSFYAHIGRKPSIKHSLDRIDNSKGYIPGNIQWATYSQQSRNQRVRKTGTTGFRGVHITGKSNKYAACIYYHGKQISIKPRIEIWDAICDRKKLENRFWN